MKHVNLPVLCGTYDYLSSLSVLDLRFCNISTICEDFLFNYNIFDKQWLTLNLENNSITALPSSVMKWNQGSILISGNLFECSCDMLWMVGWMINGTNSSGPGYSVPDYKEVSCQSGQKIGTPIYKLEAVDMNCYPHKLARWTVVVLASLGSGLILIGILVFATIRRWNEVRWIAYKNFNKFIHQRGGQKMSDEVIFDAFLSYR